MPKLLYADGSSKKVYPKIGDRFSLEELEVLVGGEISTETTHDHRCLVVNDNAIKENLPFNAEASDLYDGAGAVYGNALVCDRSFID